MALIDDVRTCLRVVSDMTDSEIQVWIDAAKADMLRCGVRPELLVEQTMNSLVKSAIVCFVKGQYGYDNSEAPRFLDSYRLMLAGLLNSKSNICHVEEPEEQPEEESEEQPEGGEGGNEVE